MSIAHNYTYTHTYTYTHQRWHSHLVCKLPSMTWIRSGEEPDTGQKPLTPWCYYRHSEVLGDPSYCLTAERPVRQTMYQTSNSDTLVVLCSSVFTQPPMRLFFRPFEWVASYPLTLSLYRLWWHRLRLPVWLVRCLFSGSIKAIMRRLTTPIGPPINNRWAKLPRPTLPPWLWRWVGVWRRRWCFAKLPPRVSLGCSFEPQCPLLP